MSDEIKIYDDLPASGNKYHGRKLIFGILEMKVYLEFLFKLKQMRIPKQELIGLMVEGIMNEDPDFMKFLRKKIPVRTFITQRIKKDIEKAEIIEETIETINQKEIEEIYDFLETEEDEL